MVSQGLIQFLLSQTTLTAIVGQAIYVDIAPHDGPLPQIIVQQISGTEDVTFDGPLNMGKDRYQLSCWSDTTAQAESLAIALRNVLNGVQTALGTQFAQWIEVLDERDMPHISPDDSLLRAYCKQIDVSIYRNN